MARVSGSYLVFFLAGFTQIIFKAYVRPFEAGSVEIGKVVGCHLLSQNRHINSLCKAIRYPIAEQRHLNIFLLLLILYYSGL